MRNIVVNIWISLLFISLPAWAVNNGFPQFEKCFRGEATLASHYRNTPSLMLGALVSSHGIVVSDLSGAENHKPFILDQGRVSAGPSFLEGKVCYKELQFQKVVRAKASDCRAAGVNALINDSAGAYRALMSSPRMKCWIL